MELLNLGPAVLDHKRHAYQEGRETDCKILCSDGHVMVRSQTEPFIKVIFFNQSIDQNVLSNTGH